MGGHDSRNPSTETLLFSALAAAKNSAKIVWMRVCFAPGRCASLLSTAWTLPDPTSRKSKTCSLIRKFGM
jgi:hypothetical protein